MRMRGFAQLDGEEKVVEHAQVMQCWHEFRSDLNSLTMAIRERNKTRKTPFMHMSPDILDAAVSV